MSPSTTKLCLFGAAPGTSNLGVDALFHSTVAGLVERLPGAAFTVFDYGRGVRQGALETRDQSIPHDLVGANHSRRLWRADTLRTMGWAARLGGLGNPGVRALREADAVLDLSGGDSFTDLYGRHRFETIVLPKRLALATGTPLVLLPQTYGPFQDSGMRAEAADVTRAAAVAWARDARSYTVLRGLLGAAFDPRRHRLGVDMAFGLEARPPADGRAIDATLERWLADGSSPVVGVNVSGLVWLDGERRAGYGFRADYPALVRGLVERLLAESDARVALVPHVLDPPGHYESDLEAALQLADSIGSRHAERLTVLQPPYDQCEIKHAIARLDWFSGTRMHATIAALSSGVPASAVAYSPKFLGVFECCDQADGVADPIALSTDDALARLWRSFERRDEARARLNAALPGVRETLAAQLDSVVTTCRRSRRDASSA